MKRLLLPLCAVAMLAGCNTIANVYNVVTGVSITQSQIDASMAAYDVAVGTPLAVYRYSDAAFTVPRRYCTKTRPLSINDPCANYSVLAKMQPVDKAVNNAFRDLQTKVTGCNVAHDQSACSGLPGAKVAFDNAVNIAKATAASTGVF